MNYTIDKFGTKIAIQGTTDDKVSSLPDADTSKQLERIADILTELENLRRVAGAAEEQAKAAEEQAKVAKMQAEAAEEQSRKSNRRSNINTGISVVAVIVSFLGWLVPQELAFETIQNILECTANILECIAQVFN